MNETGSANRMQALKSAGSAGFGACIPDEMPLPPANNPIAQFMAEWWRRLNGDNRPYLLLVTSVCLLGLALGVVLPGCGRSEPAVQVFTSQVATTAPVVPEGQGLIFAVACEDEPDTTYKAYLPLVEYLSRQTGIPISLSIKNSSALVNDMLRSGDADLARISSGSYTRLKDDVNLDLLALESCGGSTSFQALIIVRQDSPCENFAQLRGKSFALVDHIATAGYDYPLFLIREQGRNSEDYFSEVVYSGSHGRSIMEVYYGIVDGASVASYVLAAQIERYPELAGTIKIIGRSSNITRGPIVAGPYLSSDYKARFSTALMAMNSDQEGREVLKGLGLDSLTSGSSEDFQANRYITVFAHPSGNDTDDSGFNSGEEGPAPNFQEDQDDYTLSHPYGLDVDRAGKPASPDISGTSQPAEENGPVGP